LLHHQNNYVEHLNNDKAAKSFNILATSSNVLHNYNSNFIKLKCIYEYIYEHFSYIIIYIYIYSYIKNFLPGV